MIRSALATATPGTALLRDAEHTYDAAMLAAALDAEAGWLQRRGVRRVALLADNGTPFVISDLALLQLGGVNVPVPGFFTPAQRAHLLADAAIDAVLTDDPARFAAADHGFQPVGRAPGSGLVLLQRPAPAPLPLPAGTVKITYTSGSTGTPRGICLTAATLEATARALVEATATLKPDPHLCLLPLATLLENIAGVYAPLLAGSTCLLAPQAATGIHSGGLDAGRMLALIDTQRPASMILVPELLRALVVACDRGWRPPDSLRFIAVGGAVVPAGLLDAAERHALPVYEGYGLSECGSVVCLNTPQAARRGRVGRPLGHVRVRIDADGEIHVAGAVMAGRLGEASGPAPAEVATGDLGAIDDDGFVSVDGRRRHLLITSFGRNVSPEWVEAELSGEPPIAHALVTGDGRPWLCAVVSPRDPGTSREAIAQAVTRANARLPEYARVRHFIVSGTSPSFADGTLTANGRPCRERWLARHATRIESLYTREEYPT